MKKEGNAETSSGNGTGNKPEKLDFLITGIGASAGGIQALPEFFSNVSADSGIAYVVVLHLSPDHDSKLAEILQLVSKIPVTQINEKTYVKPDHVYVVPPNHHLILEDGHIIVSKNMLIEERRAPVDIFFRTLGDTHGERAICVILSGTGANGSMGMKRVKEKGGAVYVQEPAEAEFSEMPRNSIATGLVDEVLPVAKIAAKIMTYKENLKVNPLPVDTDNHPNKPQKELIDIFTQLRLRTGHDFTNYKRPTILRRIARRIQMRNLTHLESYKLFLQEHPEEVSSLLKDLLISVTNFFRDQKAFEYFEQHVLPELFTDKTSDDEVRLWVVGCATGEEAYSIAMLCAEKMLGFPEAPKVQIFATDIDDAALAKARHGFYTLNDVADISQERLSRFFDKESNGYRIRREIREMILFANHNFLKDPLAHLNLITCRNVLIYLNQKAQQRVMETFHFSLIENGFLFLGSSESINDSTQLYSTFNQEHRIFRRRIVATGMVYPVPESTPSFHIENTPFSNTLKSPLKAAENISFSDVHQEMLELYAPLLLLLMQISTLCIFLKTRVDISNLQLGNYRQTC